MEKPKSILEVRDFLNSLPEKFLGRDFLVQQENNVHRVHFLDLAKEDMYYDEEDVETGSMTISEWKEHMPDTDISTLKIGIPKGAPMIAEDF